MHICTCIPSYLPIFGGAEVGTHTILKTLSKTTVHRFSVITPTTDVQLPRHEIIDGVEIYRFQRPKIWANWFAPTLSSFLPINRLLRQLKPDVLHIAYILPTGLASWITGHFLHLPIVMTLVGNDIYDPFYMPPRILQKIAAQSIQRTSHIIASSTFVQEYLISNFNARPETISRIPFGVDCDEFHPLVSGEIIRQRYNIHPDQPLIFALQRLEVRKGVDVLLYALQNVVRSVPDVRIIIGGKGREVDHLQQLSHSLGLQEHVIFCGFIPDHEKKLYYAAANIFAMSSHFEGLGIVLAEAGACGLPVVTTNAGGTVDIVSNNETGLIVEPRDVIGLGSALTKLLQSHDMQQTMGENASQHINKNFSLRFVSSAFNQIFEDAFAIAQIANNT